MDTIRKTVENSLYTVTNDDLRRLDASEAVALLSNLLWAEATRLGIPISKVHISANVSIPDAGVDADISHQTAAGDLIRAGRTAYQVKSGDSFQPQREAAIRRELFGDKKPCKPNLKRRIRECLNENGTYVLVCTGVDPVDRSLAEDHLRRFFAACDYTNPRCEVWVQNQLRGFLTKYPSIALDVNGHDAGALRGYPNWAGDADMGFLFQRGAKQDGFISDLQTALRAAGNATHVHVRGAAGIGKTRLVFEAVQPIDLRPLVLYTNRPAELLNGEFMATLTREDNQYAVILVVDECSENFRTQIWNRLRSRGQRIKLVSIFNQFEDFSGGSILDAPLLEREKIVQIIESYNIPRDQAERFANMCSGSPRVAHVVGLNLQLNPDDLTKSPGTIDVWGRFVAGIDDPNSDHVKDAIVVLRYLALFKRFGYGDPVVAEAKSVSALIEKDHKHITWGKFREIVSALRKRKILQGETTLYISPELFHIWLWGEWWNIYGEGFELASFAEEFASTLLPWFLEMFKYAEQSQVAKKVVRRLLGPSGPFQAGEFLASRLGGGFFLALTDVDPEQALACLQRTVGGWSQTQLLEFRDGRRGVIHALERIAIWKESFCGAAQLLLKLAEAENETWANNATGVFAGLFSPGPGEVAPTEASPMDRFPILAEALFSESDAKRAVALKACDAALETQRFTRMVGAEHQGFKPKPELWTPRTYGEIYSAYREVWNLLRGRLAALPAEQNAQAARILLSKGGAIASRTNLGPLVLETWREILAARLTTKADILGELFSLLRFCRSELTPEIITAVEEFRDELVGNDFASHLKRYVGMDLLGDALDEESRPTDGRDRKIRALAEQCVTQPELLGRELAWLVTDEAKTGYLFGYELAKLDTNNSFLGPICDAQRKPTPNSSSFFLSGYMRAIFETNVDTWEHLLDQFSYDDQIRIHVPELTWRSGMTDRAAVRILQLAQTGQMEVGRFGMFCFGSVIKELSEGVFRQWAEFLVEKPDVRCATVLVNLLHIYYLDGKWVRKLPGDLALRALSHDAFFRKDEHFRTMDDYYWAEVGTAFVSGNPTESLKLAQIIISHFGEEGTIVGAYHSKAHKVLMEITRQNAREVWQLVSERLGPPIDTRAFRLKSWLHGDTFSPGGENGVLPLIPLDDVWKWVDANPNERAWYLATFVPKQLFHSAERPCLAREVLIRYGGDDRVRRNLMANFSTEGWSGSASFHYQQKKQCLLKFRDEETDSNVKLWIDEYAGDLESRIELERIREERDAF